MANEASVQSSLNINKTVGSKNIQFNNLPSSSFSADVAGPGGPAPGTFTVTAEGTQVDLLDYLASPGLYQVYNVGEVPIDWGVFDPSTNKAVLKDAVLPGESYVGRFSPYLFGEVGPGTAGTGTIGADNNVLFFRARGATGYINLSAYDS